MENETLYACYARFKNEGPLHLFTGPTVLQFDADCPMYLGNPVPRIDHPYIGKGYFLTEEAFKSLSSLACCYSKGSESSKVDFEQTGISEVSEVSDPVIDATHPIYLDMGEDQ